MKESNLSLGNLTAAPGERNAGMVPVRVAGVDIEIPVVLINGAEAGPTLCVTAAIHGAEYPCVEAAKRLAFSLDPGALRGQAIVVPIANPVAFRARSIYVTPLDGKNLNRQFPGKERGTFSEALAYWLFHEVMQRADYYVDLHGGDMIEALMPFGSWASTGDDAVDAAADSIARAFGIPYIVLPAASGSGIGGATHIAVAQAGIPAFLAEAGGQGILDARSVQILHEGLLRVMASLDMVEPSAPAVDAPSRFTGWHWLRADVDGLYYPAVQVGDRVRAGQAVGKITDVFGETLQPVEAPGDGTVLFVVTSLAINTGDPLLAIAY